MVSYAAFNLLPYFLLALCQHFGGHGGGILFPATSPAIHPSLLSERDKCGKKLQSRALKGIHRRRCFHCAAHRYAGLPVRERLSNPLQ